MAIKIGTKAVNKICIGSKEVLKIIQGNGTSTGILKYQAGSTPPIPSLNRYKAIVRYDSSSTYQVAEIYDNNTLIGTSQPNSTVLTSSSTGVWRYNLSQLSSILIGGFIAAGSSVNLDYSNSNSKLHMVYSKTNSWWSLPAYINVQDTNTNIYYRGTVEAAVTDAVENINMSEFPNSSTYLNIGGYQSDAYTTGSSLFTLNVTSTTLEIEFNADITSVTIASNKNIAANAYEGEVNLTYVLINNINVTIGADAFSGCTSLTYLTYSGTRAQLASVFSTWDSNWDRGSSLTEIQCADGIFNW